MNMNMTIMARLPLTANLTLLVLAASMLLFVSGAAWAEKGQDHPMIKRYSGSDIRYYVQKEFDEAMLPLGKAKGNGFADSRRVEGKVTAIDYKYPRGRSTLEVYKNYEDGLLKAGFTPLYRCADKACGKGGPADKYLNYRWVCFEQRHLTAQLARSDGDIYVNLHVCKGVDRAYVTVVEAKPMQQGLVQVDADALANEIERTGHASVYGIFFDTDSTTIKPESDQALEQIAKLLKNKPDLKLYVVGHTDSVGTLAYNKDLSIRRARAVVRVLTTKYAIASGRLLGDGVGPLAPVASNKGEEGRTKNRRVELVAQ